MFTRYLRRELSGRRKQTAIIAIAMALAIGLVVIVNSLSAGVRDAQGAALASVYGVGTDITVTATPTPPAAGEGRGGPRFEFDADAGTTTSDGTTAVSQSVLMSGRGTATFDASAVDTVSGQDGVKAASGVLALTNSTFDGELPQRGTTGSTSGGTNATPPQGAGPGGGGQFDVNSFSVMGVDSKSDTIGPLASATLQDGRLLSADDAGKNNLVVDATYSTTEELKLKDKVEIAGTKFTIVGIVAGSGADAETASNTYIPLDVAQKLSDNAKKVSTVYVQALSASQIAAVKTGLQAALPENTVNTQEDLAATVSGSLSTASGLVSSLGTWLSIAVLAVAFLLAILLTLSGVARRTREFGTLKAIGWRNSSIVRQVAGESLVQSLLGGALGILIGLAGILAINFFAPTLSASAAATGPMGAGGAGGPGTMQGGPAAVANAVGSAAEVVLNLPITPMVGAVAVAIAIAGGLLAGILGGWRAARLRPAEALRSVA
ncbi:ABC transporter permease [Paeniglutamicibacter sp. NPDC091659]|uniref:ABC transporter permease n=1 Tax=Paeniglutamicibacter sp. NPDC091659 TaxID=3364389 RepID=UPI0037F2F1C4